MEFMTYTKMSVSKDPQIDIDWCDTFMSDRYLIDVNPRVFAIWVVDLSSSCTIVVMAVCSAPTSSGYAIIQYSYNAFWIFILKKKIDTDSILHLTQHGADKKLSFSRQHFQINYRERTSMCFDTKLSMSWWGPNHCDCIKDRWYGHYVM